MKILTRTLVSNSDMIKNYKGCREKAEEFGKIIILKNNKPDAVLFSIEEYSKLAGVIERLDGLDEEKINKVIETIPED